MLRKLPQYLSVTAIFLFSFVSNVLANGGELESEDHHVEVAELITPTLEDIIRSNSIKIVFISSAVVIITVILTIILKNTSEGAKRILFATITIPIILTTLFMVGSTLFLNFKSISGGPVHWHASYEIWDCGNQIELLNPQGISNKVGMNYNIDKLVWNFYINEFSAAIYLIQLSKLDKLNKKRKKLQKGIQMKLK